MGNAEYMGTHPIFESDFDCLTENIMNSRSPRVQTIEIDDSKVHLSSMKFDDHIMLGVSDSGTFGSFYRVFKSTNQHKDKEPVFEIVPIFGCDDQYFQVVCRYLSANLPISLPLMVSVAM